MDRVVQVILDQIELTEHRVSNNQDKGLVMDHNLTEWEIWVTCTRNSMGVLIKFLMLALRINNRANNKRLKEDLEVLQRTKANLDHQVQLPLLCSNNKTNKLLGKTE